MPYIKQEDRDRVLNAGPEKPGELNYIFTLVADEYVQKHGVSYQIISEVLSSFEAAKLEFYRRVAAPYEDKKKEENGEVYTVLGNLSVRSDDRDSAV